MRGKGFITWVTAFTLALVVALAWLWHRDIIDRYHAWRDRDETVHAVRQEVRELEENLESTRKRVEDLDRDPIEMEAAIRRIRRLVRPGETVYRIEEIPPEGAAAEVAPGPGSTDGSADNAEEEEVN